jgi:hypothetical protein
VTLEMESAHSNPPVISLSVIGIRATGQAVR